MASDSRLRGRLAVGFVAGLALLVWRSGSEVVPPEQVEIGRYETARAVFRELMEKSGDLLTASERQTVRNSISQLQQASSLKVPAEVLINSHSPITQVTYVLNQNANVTRVNLDGGEAVVSREWATPDRLVLVRFALGGLDADEAPQFVYREVDLAAPRAVTFDRAKTTYAVIYVKNARPGKNGATVPVMAGGAEVGRLRLAIAIPEAGRLRVSIEDNGQRTPAVVGLYTADARALAPPQGISFDAAGYSYRAGRLRPYNAVRVWPGTPEQRQVAVVDGGFEMEVPAGEYTLIVGKGFEFTPVTRKVTVRAGGETAERVELTRWVDMASKGWHSGDGHVHFARPTAEANGPMMTWARAEDVRLINVVRMGDAQKTYFEQYAFGQAGRVKEAGYMAVPGQEDPRTDNFGHTLHMNLQAAIRYPGEYYLYDKVFDEVHRQGGLSGYAHAYQPLRFSFYVRRNMSLYIPQNKVDFAEIAEFGEIDSSVYYEFLNLGFKLTATAGSDVPWGPSIGAARMYAYTGRALDADEWFRAVKAGRTFVTTGPMMDLTVNGERPGAELRVKAGEVVKIAATASGLVAKPQYLEIVEQGDVVGGTVGKERTLTARKELKVTHSTWIAARCAGGLTSPVYVRVGEERTWKKAAVPGLIAVRMKQLDELEATAREGVRVGNEGNWNNPEGLRAQVPAIVERIEKSRAIYRTLLAEATR